MASVPDFGDMRHRGQAVFDEGLPPLPVELSTSDSVPVSYWTTGVCGAVQFIFFFPDDGGGFRPADVTFQYGRGEDGWHAVRSGVFWSCDWNDAIGSPTFMRHYPSRAIEVSHSSIDDEPEAGALAVVMSGRHSPEVAEIWFVQQGNIDKRPASGHFGSWTICTEELAPLRVEARDAAGILLGAIDEPLEAYFPEQAIQRLTVEGAERSHRHGGRIQIQEIERFEAKVVVRWLITLVPDPDAQLAEDLEAHGHGSAEPWDIERIDQHVALIDVLKLTARLSQITLTDDLGTVYTSRGGGVSFEHGAATKSSEFEPAVPEDAATITVHWEDLVFPVSLH